MQHSKHQQWSRQQIQAAHVRTMPKCWLKFNFITYLHCALLRNSQRKGASHAQEEHFWAGSWSFDAEKAGFKASWHNFASAARIRYLVEIDTAPLDFRITPHNSMQQIICLGWGYWMQMHIPSSQKLCSYFLKISLQLWQLNIGGSAFLLLKICQYTSVTGKKEKSVRTFSIFHSDCSAWCLSAGWYCISFC